MRRIWQSVWGPLGPAVRGLLFVLAAVYVAALVGAYSHTYNLYDWLVLSGPRFRKGEVWRIVSYALLPAGIMDFLFNGMMLLFLGPLLERAWSRRELWCYCGISAGGAGLAQVLLRGGSPAVLVGTAPVIFGLLAAWGLVCGHEKVLFGFVWEMSVRHAAMLFAVFGFLVMLATTGAINALIMLCGGVAGLLYLAARSRVLRARPSQTVTSERIGRLEL